MCKLTIVTINRNNKHGLRKTIESVVNQTFTDFEYIIIDGASTDNSVDIIREYADKITYWISEPDKGIYNAMNKGILNASGEYLLMLNSGDYLTSPEVIESVFKNNYTEDLIYGNIIWQYNDLKTEVAKQPNILRFSYLSKVSLFHQATFIKRTLHDKTGLYNENFKVISDWAFFVLSICKHNCSYQYFNNVISVCDRAGISCEDSYKDIIAREKEEFLFKNFYAFLEDYNDYNKYILKRQKGVLFKFKQFVKSFIR